ncbi:uncharacterized protein LACBIDRAFT_315645 [Laccaria bicolor S238N-H82]|uniref:Predicted protein n=1 Tax=Laccaria bicolor (strain S238N-H82 / ATCC MYA-4686) TaxID=486041 RepID=B0D2U3_LACBS|nr:uncharacterized protein LACBIDRAFT_315645 [Laccaria bicolor S238N-H82]EDR10812.1 predicted protein [Laccaria bicolor S238N-H82]|eukprot:XP_001878113.1 predicted protein [Laccaria bicolor S238N-H82]
MGQEWDSSDFVNVIINQNIFVPLRSTLVLDMTYLDLSLPSVSKRDLYIGFIGAHQAS